MNQYPKDSSGRQLIEAVVDRLRKALLEAPFEQRQEALVWLDSVKPEHQAHPFKAAIQDILRPGVETEAAEKELTATENKVRMQATLDRIAAKSKAE
ncbi:MAG TPA: hypothetical protein VG897_06735 [Terriglobales bacterium]|nr:hypothetical protein [Terriglobales bacterium]